MGAGQLIKGFEGALEGMALNEKKVAAVSFPTNEARMDYRGFVSEDPQVHSWAKDLYEKYWAVSKPVIA